MDLIHCNKDFVDVNVMKNFDMDMANGSSENDFKIKLNKDAHCCERGDFVYVEGTEFGGVIDQIEVSTSDDSVAYGGITWIGLVKNRIICPPVGYDYYVVSGNASNSLRTILAYVGLDEFIEVDDADPDDEIQIPQTNMDRFCNAYDGFSKIIRDYGGKITFNFHSHKLHVKIGKFQILESLNVIDGNFDYSAIKNGRKINHIIACGKGELKDRAVIHLYADEFGEIQPYSIENPIKDSDYIFDDRNKKIFGKNENVLLYENTGAETIYNYEKLTSEPADWNTIDFRTANYYEKSKSESGSESWIKVEPVVSTSGTVLKKQPADWESNFQSYCILNTDGNFINVSKVARYEEVKTQPSGWSSNYREYYTYDSVNDSYSNVRADSQPYYAGYGYSIASLDWERNYSKYFIKKHTSQGDVYEQVATKYVDYTYVLKYESECSDILVEFKNLDSYIVKSWTYTEWDEKGEYPVRNRIIKNCTIEKVYETYGVGHDWTETYVIAEIRNMIRSNWLPFGKLSKRVHGNFPPDLRETMDASSDGIVYMKLTRAVAPNFATLGGVYRRIQDGAPTFQTGKYYKMSTEYKSPKFRSGVFYEQFEDRYKNLVAYAIEKYNEENGKDEISIDVNSNRGIDLGDLIYVEDEITGIRTMQYVTKKILNMSDNEFEISYEVG